MDAQISNLEIIELAKSHIRPHYSQLRLHGNVASVVVSKSGDLFVGVCIQTDTGSNICAEQSAACAMATSDQFVIDRVVTVSFDTSGNLLFRSPCGNCREFLMRLDVQNSEANILKSFDESVSLRDLLPLSEF